METQQWLYIIHKPQVGINTKNKYNLKIKIVKVETLQEAIYYLRNN